MHNPTGEAAFHSLMKGFAWAENPMLPRLKNLKASVPLTALYGADSWITAVPEEQFKEIMGGMMSFMTAPPDISNGNQFWKFEL